MTKKLLTTAVCWILGCHGPAEVDEPGAAVPPPTLTCESVSVPRSNDVDHRRFERLDTQLNSYILDADVSRRDSAYQPQAILPSLHPWFKDNVCTESWENQTIYVLPELPDELVAQIKQMTVGIPPHGMGILSGEFWAKIQRLQKLGLKPVFLEFTPEFDVAGVYVHNTGMIGFDIFANPGTPDHEYRHYLQRKALPFPGRPREISYECARSADRFFGELDATTTQLKFWIGSFENITSEIHSISKQRTYPQGDLFQVNLHYPVVAASWVSRRSCPRGLLDVVQTIAQKTEEAEGRLSDIAYRLIKLRGTVHQIQKRLLPECHQAEPICDRDRESVIRYQREMSSLSGQLNSELTAEASNRPHYVREILKSLPPAIYQDLWRTSGAFHLLIDGTNEVL